MNLFYIYLMLALVGTFMSGRTFERLVHKTNAPRPYEYFAATYQNGELCLFYNGELTDKIKASNFTIDLWGRDFEIGTKANLPRSAIKTSSFTPAPRSQQ